MPKPGVIFLLYFIEFKTKNVHLMVLTTDEVLWNKKKRKKLTFHSTLKVAYSESVQHILFMHLVVMSSLDYPVLSRPCTFYETNET